ncbi:hypothetical protein HJFPF1_04745 [Paramyrothecium foliicola]|nr:hypothetical protein HJFPF1_04745 [Paramyrothecium foliicola]
MHNIVVRPRTDIWSRSKEWEYVLKAELGTYRKLETLERALQALYFIVQKLLRRILQGPGCSYKMLLKRTDSHMQVAAVVKVTCNG